MNKRLLLAGSVRILTRYKLRSFFMSLGIVIGVAALVVMRSTGSGAEQQMLDKIHSADGRHQGSQVNLACFARLLKLAPGEAPNGTEIYSSASRIFATSSAAR
jgi:hypothetical protein